MLLRIEVSVASNWTGDERKFRRCLKSRVAALASEVADDTNVELNRVQAIENKPKRRTTP